MTRTEVERDDVEVDIYRRQASSNKVISFAEVMNVSRSDPSWHRSEVYPETWKVRRNTISGALFHARRPWNVVIYAPEHRCQISVQGHRSRRADVSARSLRVILRPSMLVANLSLFALPPLHWIIMDNRRRRVPPTRWLSAWLQELHMFGINHPAFAARLFAQFSSELFHLWTQLYHAVIHQDNTGITECRSGIQACLEVKLFVFTESKCYNNADAGTQQAMAAAAEFGYAPMQEVEAEVAAVEDFDDMPELVDNFGEDL
ncbi:hypothetical protein B0H13DRAFT_1862005 [Mycena leptocephala]|nr:hypothetical protein B0H13DRAFT_1862005 [Mycena leptocephala]